MSLKTLTLKTWVSRKTPEKDSLPMEKLIKEDPWYARWFLNNWYPNIITKEVSEALSLKIDLHPYSRKHYWLW